VTTLDPSLLGDIDMLYSNHLIPAWLMVAHGFKRLGARLTTIATPTAASTAQSSVSATGKWALASGGNSAGQPPG
jgi:hypothetical protein